MITISENCACPSIESSVRTKIWKEIKRTQLRTYLNIYLSKIFPFMKNYEKNLHNSYMSACQSDISDSETGQILIMVIMVIRNNINSESKLFEIKVQLKLPTDLVFYHQ